MGLQGEKKLEDILTGALIGLARTTYSHLKTENTDRVVTCALSVLVRVDADEEELEKQGGLFWRIYSTGIDLQLCRDTDPVSDRNPGGEAGPGKSGHCSGSI